MASPSEPAASALGEPVGGGGTAAFVVQVGVLGVTFAMGVLGFFTAQSAWYVALAQAAIGLGLVGWLVARRSRRVLAMVVPIVSFALTAGLSAASATVAVACMRVLPAFEQVPPPPGVTIEPFVPYGGVGCMAETPVRVASSKRDDPSPRDVWADVFDHYRRELPKYGWELIADDDGDPSELRAERDGMYVVMYTSEGRVYLDLGRCGEWGTHCRGSRAIGNR